MAASSFQNVWKLERITNQKTTSRIKHLLNVGDERTLRFLSVEPQAEAIDLGAALPKVDWLIHGGESGHGARPFDLRWAADLIEQCHRDGVAYFLKQLGSHVVDSSGRLKFKDNHAGDWDEWSKSVRVREMPGICFQRRKMRC